jgi:hypothetical protein
MNSPSWRCIALCGILCAIAACSQGAGSSSGANAATGADGTATGSASGGSSGGKTWIANGATACARYLTPDVVAEILTQPAGKSDKLSPQACSFNATNYSSIAITLMAAGPETFDHYQQSLVNPVPLAGVGDKASRSAIGIDAVKGTDRMCTIDVTGAPGSTRLHGEALAQKLGQICNKLFALP